MDLKKINLPDFLLADLYKNNLVLIENDLELKGRQQAAEAGDEMILSAPGNAATIPDEAETALAFLGSNKKYISIIVSDEQAIHLEEESLDILSNILSACKFNLADVAIVNTHRQTVNDAILRKHLSPKVVLLFGVATTTVDLPFSIPMYKPQPFNNCTYLQSVSLEKMKGTGNEARLEKSKLWVCLKNLFAV